MTPKHEFCPEHSGQRVLLKALLGLVGTSVVLLLFQINLTLSMGDALKAEMADSRERIKILEYQIAVVTEK